MSILNEHLITRDGKPRGFSDGLPSHDGQNYAQCIQTLAVCGCEPEDIETGWKIWLSMCSLPQLNRDTFGQRRLIPRVGQYPQLRWTVGPAVLATTNLIVRLQSIK